MLGLALVPLVLGSWTYGGFVADPSPAAIPMSNPPAALPREHPTPVARAVVPATTDAHRRSQVAASPTVASPPRYRLADATGQVWEHADPTWLQAFVASRNAQPWRFVVNRASCASGTCR